MTFGETEGKVERSSEGSRNIQNNRTKRVHAQGRAWGRVKKSGEGFVIESQCIMTNSQANFSWESNLCSTRPVVILDDQNSWQEQGLLQGKMDYLLTQTGPYGLLKQRAIKRAHRPFRDRVIIQWNRPLRATVRRGRVVNIAASYSESPGFKSQPGDLPQWQEVFRHFLSPSGQILE
jgi:hypothetical protein